MHLNDEQSRAVWDKVHERLNFFPNCLSRDTDFHIPPFKINGEYVIYGIEDTDDDISDLGTLITNAFIKCTAQGERIYALDWQHSSFLYDPRNKSEQQSVFVADKRYLGGGYNAYFPGYYPDGDYYFFISEDFRFGYLTHPWREEAWVFGDELIAEFERFYKSLGWKKLK